MTYDTTVVRLTISSCKLFSDPRELQKANALLNLARSANKPAQKLELIKSFLSSPYPELRIVGLGLTVSFVKSAADKDCERVKQILIECAPHLASYISKESVSRLQLNPSKPPRDFNPALTLMFIPLIVDMQTGGDPYTVPPANDGVILTAGLILRKLLCVTGLELLYSAAVGYPKQSLLEKFLDSARIEQSYFNLINGIMNTDGTNFYTYPARVVSDSQTLKPDEWCDRKLNILLGIIGRNFALLRKLFPENAATRTEAELVEIFGHNALPFKETVRLDARSLSIGAGVLIDNSGITERDLNKILEVSRGLLGDIFATPRQKQWTLDENIAVTGILLARKILSNPADMLTVNGVA